METLVIIGLVAAYLVLGYPIAIRANWEVDKAIGRELQLDPAIIKASDTPGWMLFTHLVWPIVLFVLGILAAVDAVRWLLQVPLHDGIDWLDGRLRSLYRMGPRR